MGCFSFMCKACGEPILSNSFTGQETHLYLLKDGKVLQEMEGQYDSYGKVFDPAGDGSIEWNMEWGNVCDLMWTKSSGDGIAAVHSKCYTGKVPTTQSADDPNQGWGDGLELIANVDEDLEYDK